MSQKLYDKTNSTNPYLININKADIISYTDENKLTAEYIWDKCGKKREDLVQYVFDYYRKKGFPTQSLTDAELVKSFNKLRALDTIKIVTDKGEIKNSNSTCTDIIKHFCWKEFYSSKKDSGVSVIDVFNDDEKLKKVIMNRMGWNSSGEDGSERPYVFGITDAMILQGIRSSGLGGSISQFKPAVAKFLYQKYVPEGGTVFDYSAGWGARLLAAMSLGIEYYGIDPLTSRALNRMCSFFNGNGKVINGISENVEIYKDVTRVDFIMSSPPYFKLEIYSGDKTQCYNRFPEYNEWLQKYFKKTVENCIGIMKDSATFGLVVVEKFKKYELGKNMIDVCLACGLEKIDYYPFKTARSHLSGKRNNQINTKFTDGVYIFKKVGQKVYAGKKMGCLFD